MKVPVAPCSYSLYDGTENCPLVLNSFRRHLSDKLKAKVCKVCTYLTVIPGKLTGKQQPLNISINRPFEVEFHQHYA